MIDGIRVRLTQAVSQHCGGWERRHFGQRGLRGADSAGLLDSTWIARGGPRLSHLVLFFYSTDARGRGAVNCSAKFTGSSFSAWDGLLGRDVINCNLAILLALGLASSAAVLPSVPGKKGRLCKAVLFSTAVGITGGRHHSGVNGDHWRLTLGVPDVVNCKCCDHAWDGLFGRDVINCDSACWGPGVISCSDTISAWGCGPRCSTAVGIFCSGHHTGLHGDHWVPVDQIWGHGNYMLQVRSSVHRTIEAEDRNGRVHVGPRGNSASDGGLVVGTIIKPEMSVLSVMRMAFDGQVSTGAELRTLCEERGFRCSS